MRYAGLDLGDKTIGVAISDELLFSAQPLTVIRRQNSIATDIEELKAILAPYTPIELVLGLPKNMKAQGPNLLGSLLIDLKKSVLLCTSGTKD